MSIRRAFTVFLDVQSNASPDLPPATDWTLDWRWFCEPRPRALLPGQQHLTDRSGAVTASAPGASSDC